MPQVVFSSGVNQVSPAGVHSLFLKTDGSLWAAGHNANGKVGKNTLNAGFPPTKIVDSGVAGISAGGNHSIYWTNEGDVYVFGSDQSGQLGLGRSVYVRTPRLLYDPN